MSKANATFAFWTSYINMVEDVLLLTRATRTGNWELHMSTIRRILPWMFAYDRSKYSLYLSAYYMEMRDLATTHPSVHETLVNGNFAVNDKRNMDFHK
ncbi:hypothetical protein HOLleu_00222 [Holothuria leucospilota]|uniref:Uncharacterized protein n=1 Tax=Holothuria leucospilota TaxID=206669 RepID=A0A9Q1CML3_HOLLE|nr:hypothetical protein HOLleu_00222 [Holothuria leucospilota]